MIQDAVELELAKFEYIYHTLSVSPSIHPSVCQSVHSFAGVYKVECSPFPVEEGGELNQRVWRWGWEKKKKTIF